MSSPYLRLSVILCTRQPDPVRLGRTLAALAAQHAVESDDEILLIDNGSEPPLTVPGLPAPVARGLRIVRETTPGLTPARLRGIREATGDVVIFVDDDNVLEPAFLATTRATFSAQPGLGAAGGPVRPEFAAPPPPWLTEFHGLLALHEHGSRPQVARGGPRAPWPNFAPVGAGLCVRRAEALRYAAAVEKDPLRQALDRRAGELTSGGDNDLVFTILRAGGDVGYVPGLAVTHLIPVSRFEPEYLSRLNRGIQRSWVRVLALHGACPWSRISRASVPLRSLRAWWRCGAWRGPVEKIRYHGLHGRFLGQADLIALPVSPGPDSPSS